MKLIAETAWHHEGDLNFMLGLIDDIIDAGADIIKCHLTLDLEEYMLQDHKSYKTLKKYLINESSWEEILKRVVQSRSDLMLLYNDTRSIEFGSKFEPAFVEIHSVCLNDYNLLNKLRKSIVKDTKIVLGVGGSSLDEIENAINVLNNDNIILMFGFQNYPTDYKNINFNKIRKIMRMYPNYKFGYADHTSWDNPNNELITLMGAALGMQYIEKHVSNAYGEDRLDYSAAVSLEMFQNIKDKLTVLNDCNGDGKIALNKGEREYSVNGPMKKAPVLKNDIKKTDTLKWDHLRFARTGKITDLNLVELNDLIGASYTGDLRKDHVLTKSDLETR